MTKTVKTWLLALGYFLAPFLAVDCVDWSYFDASPYMYVAHVAGFFLGIHLLYTVFVKFPDEKPSDVKKD